MMRNHRWLLVFSLFAVLALSGCLNSITLDDPAGLEDGGGDEASIDAPETVVSAAPGSAASVEPKTETSAASSDDSTQLRSGSGDVIQGFALDELEIARELEDHVNDFRTRERRHRIGVHELRDSSSLSVAARFQSRRLAKNVLRLYSAGISEQNGVLDDLSGAKEENLERRFARHSAAECNDNLESFDPETGDMNLFTANVPVSGETVEAVEYDEIAGQLTGSQSVSDEDRVSAAVFDVLKQDPDVSDNMTTGDYRYMGVGVKNVPSERVMIVVQDYC
jgi:uncharacterized protein YkwD